MKKVEGIDFSYSPLKYWSKSTKMSYIQRRIIIYSIMYYEEDESCVSDKYYNAISQQLVNLMKESTKKEIESTTYYYAMYDFDGSTGFDIPSRLNKKDREYLTHLATIIHDQWKANFGGVTIK